MMQRHTLQDLLHRTMTGEETFYIASEVDKKVEQFERIREAAHRYYWHWCVDEAEDASGCSSQQHLEAKALRDALNGS